MINTLDLYTIEVNQIDCDECPFENACDKITLETRINICDMVIDKLNEIKKMK